jgi:hypothetical protein
MTSTPASFSGAAVSAAAGVAVFAGRSFFSLSGFSGLYFLGGKLI